MKLITFVQEKLTEHLPANSLRRRFAKGAFWSVAAAVASQGMRFLAFVIVARILGKTGFGELGMIQHTVSMFGVFAGLGLGLTATKHVAEFRSADPARAGRIVALSSVVALISGGLVGIAVFFASPYLAQHIINAPHLKMELWIGCGLLFFNTLIGAQVGCLAGFEAFKTIARVGLFYGLLNLLLVVLGVHFWGLSGAITGMVCAMTGSCAAHHFALRKEAKKAGIAISYRDIRSEMPVLWGFSLPAFLSNVMVGPVVWGANALLSNEVDGYAKLGIFSAATQVQMALNLAGSRVGASLLPILASREAKKSVKFNRANILISWLIGVTVAVPLICFSEILGLVFGSQYAGVTARRTFVLVMFYACIMLYKQGLARVLVANSLLWWSCLSNGMWAVVLLGSAWLLKGFGAVGLAGAFMIAYTLNTICFVPLYTSRRLAPRGTLISPEAITIWLVITALACLSFFQFPLFVRAAAFIVSTVPLYIAFRRLFFGLREG